MLLIVSGFIALIFVVLLLKYLASEHKESNYNNTVLQYFSQTFLKEKKPFEYNEKGNKILHEKTVDELKHAVQVLKSDIESISSFGMFYTVVMLFMSTYITVVCTFTGNIASSILEIENKSDILIQIVTLILALLITVTLYNGMIKMRKTIYFISLVEDEINERKQNIGVISLEKNEEQKLVRK